MATPGRPGLAPVAAPTCAAISEENTMTNKPPRKKSGPRAAKATNRKNSKKTDSEAAGDHKARSSRCPSERSGRRDHRPTL